MQRRQLSIFKHFTLLFASALFFLSTAAFAEGSIRYKINHYSTISQYFLGAGSSENNLYKIDLKYLDDYLPDLQGLKRNDLKLINKRIVPGKTPLKVARFFAYSQKEYTDMYSPKKFFGQLRDEYPYTYVVVNDRLIFTETTPVPKKEKSKNFLSKHYFISGLLSKVNYAGEFVPYKNPANGHLFLVFDNASGSYCPDGEQLYNLKALLEDNFNEITGYSRKKMVHIITKKFDQKIDKEKMFAFERRPFQATP